mgnify:FL=1
MLLSDGTVRSMLDEGSLVLDPIDDGQIQPSSVDVRLDRVLRVFRNHSAVCIDPMEPTEALTEPVPVEDGHPFILHPGEFVLGSTVEEVGLTHDQVGRVEGK